VNLRGGLATWSAHLKLHREIMKKFLSVHVVACLTRQAIVDLIERFQQASDEDVRHLHTWGDTIAGRMICHWEARDRETLVQWLEKQNVRIRGNSEWVMQVEFES